MNEEEKGRQMGKLVAKCWSDEDFKKKILADPAATLKAEGMDVPAGVTVVVPENTASLFHLVIPAKPSHLSDAELDKVAAGGDIQLDKGQDRYGGGSCNPA